MYRSMPFSPAPWMRDSRLSLSSSAIIWVSGSFCRSAALAVCTVLMLRLYRLSMDSGLLQAAQSQGSYTLEVTTTRGRIYDRSLLPLTDTER